jgi:hypothetical protein
MKNIAPALMWVSIVSAFCTCEVMQTQALSECLQNTYAECMQGEPELECGKIAADMCRKK